MLSIGTKILLIAFLLSGLFVYICYSYSACKDTTTEPFRIGSGDHLDYLDNPEPSESHLPSYPDGPTYDPAKYNTDPYIQNSHNCYAYSLDFYDPALAEQCKTVLTSAKQSNHYWTNRFVRRPKSCYHLRPKPGRIHNTHKRLPYSKRMNCKRMLKGILQDIPTAKVVKQHEKCDSGYYKIAYAVDPGRTYHFYRQDEDGLWSHKDAWRAATRLDASGKVITDPATADRKYSHANLKNFCHYVCVPLQTVKPTLLK